MATSIINFTATNTSELLDSIVKLVDDVKPVALLMIGIFLGFFVIEIIVSKVLREKE